MIPEITIFILEIIGTIAFSISGALIAIKAGMDIFGVVFIGCITAFGGGIMRDVLIGSLPPNIFNNPHILFICVITALVVYIVSYKNKDKFESFKVRIDNVNNFFDAVGLGAFSVMGTEIAFSHGLYDNMFLSVTLGFLTGVGGGVIRDVLANDKPYILKKHVYALISIAGSVIYYILRIHFSHTLIISAIPLVLVVILRMFATKYRWSLSKIKF